MANLNSETSWQRIKYTVEPQLTVTSLGQSLAIIRSVWYDQNAHPVYAVHHVPPEAVTSIICITRYSVTPPNTFLCRQLNWIIWPV